jgi:iron(III) transport system ATP-binding protein
MSDLMVADVHKTLGPVHVLKGASFTGEKGKIVALLGASGSGKTTLLRSIAGLEIPEQGRIVIGGEPVLDVARGVSVPPERRNIGLVFQSYALWPHRTVAENVAFGLKLRKIPRPDLERRVAETLRKLGLEALAERYPFQLSGGQQQRVAICRALIYEPAVILLDEPLSNLDAKLREEARFWIRKLILDLGLCAVVVTHDQGEALAMSDHVLLLKDGVIVQEGTPIDIYSRPANRYTAEFVGTNNVLEGRLAVGPAGEAAIAGASWRFDGVVVGPMAAADNAPAAAVVRIERVRLADGPGPNRISMQVEGLVYLGDHWEYWLRHEDLLLRAVGDSPLGAERVWCECPKDHVWIFPQSKTETR